MNVSAAHVVRPAAGAQLASGEAPQGSAARLPIHMRAVLAPLQPAVVSGRLSDTQGFGNSRPNSASWAGMNAAARALLVQPPKRLWATYIKQLERRPRAVKSATSIIAALLGDSLAQHISNSGKERWR